MFNKQDYKQFWKVRRQLEKNYKNTSSICKKDLQGGWMIGAFLIHCYLKEKGYKSQMIVCAGHCYTKVEDWVVDVTATQFGISKKVWITNHTNYKLELEKNTVSWIFDDEIKLRQVKQLPKILNKLCWECDPIKILSLPKSMYYDT